MWWMCSRWRDTWSNNCCEGVQDEEIHEVNVDEGVQDEEITELVTAHSASILHSSFLSSHFSFQGLWLIYWSEWEIKWA